jgi:large subunit ribosomal protein L17
MRHRVRAGILGRSSSHRLAMYRNLVTSLLDHERIETTDAKAKGVRSLAERMITLGKRGDLHARRRALRVIRSRKVTAKVFDDIAVRFRERPGGYTRIIKVRNRVGDAAPMSIIELVDRPATSKPAAEAPASARPAKKKAATRKKAAAEKATEKKTAKKASAEKPAAKKAPAKKAARKKTASKQADASKTTTTKKKPGAKKTTKKK